MIVYSLYSILLNEDAYIDLINDDKDQRIKYFFKYNEGDLIKKPIFNCQEGFNMQNICETDLYPSTSGMLVFSEKFYNVMHKILEGEMELYKAELKVEDETLNCFVGKIINTKDILNEIKTVYDDWLAEENDGELFIDEPVFLKDIPDTNYCVKHSSRQNIEVFTDKFKRLSKEHQLKLRFESVQQC